MADDALEQFRFGVTSKDGTGGAATPPLKKRRTGRTLSHLRTGKADTMQSGGGLRRDTGSGAGAGAGTCGAGTSGAGSGAGAGAGTGDCPTGDTHTRTTDAWLSDVLDTPAIRLLSKHAVACKAAAASGAPLPATPPSLTDVPSIAAAIGRRLLHTAHLLIGGKRYALVEIECYLHSGDSPTHPDPFTHAHPDQACVGFYFHKVGKGFKGGSYKGLDIAFGAPGVACGFLVRAIKSTVTDETVHGSCRVVDHILGATRAGSIAGLVAKFDRQPPRLNQADTPLQLVQATPDPAATDAAVIQSTPRVGLSLKKARDGAAHAAYFSRLYRFLTDPTIKTGREYTVVALHAGGETTARIHDLTTVRADTVDRYVAAFDAGRRRAGATTSYFGRQLNTSDRLEALGACWAASNEGGGELGEDEST